MSFKNPAQFSKNSAIITVSFFVYVIISTLILLNINDGQLASRPVWDELFGRSFVIGHLGAVSGLIILFAVIIIFNRSGHLKTPFSHYREEERKIFFQKYNFACESGITKTKRVLALSVMIFSTFLPAIIPFIFYYFFNSKDYTFPVIIGITLMFIVFYKTLFLIMDTDGKRINEFFNRVNKNINDTFITLNNYSHNTTGVGVQFSINAEGIYKGRKFFLENSSSGKLLGKRVNVSSNTKILLETKSNVSLKIKKESFYPVKHDLKSDYDLVISGDSERCSQIVKKMICEFDRPLNLEITNRNIIYTAQGNDIIPFYSMEGIVLFLEFLFNLTNEIEKSPYV